jgi:F-type H+-transporting ATPase subunit a
MENLSSPTTEHAEHAAHGHEGLDVGETILHHITDANAFEFGPLGHIPLPQIHLFGLDLSITKHVVMMWLVSLLLILMFSLSFRKRKVVPTGFANMLEMVVIFIKEEIVEPNLGEEAKRYLPYLLTTFFFILANNLIGLVPFSATATGNISVTCGLAVLAFFMIQYGGIRHYGFFRHWRNYIPSGMPVWLLPIMIPVELMGMFIKPVALCIRLFANMTAGHVVILSLLCLIFVFNTIFGGAVAFSVAPLSVGFALFINLLEILVALIQAYIFTLLTSIFMGLTIHAEH